jgi:hypothetical protein
MPWLFQNSLFLSGMSAIEYAQTETTAIRAQSDAARSGISRREINLFSSPITVFGSYI